MGCKMTRIECRNKVIVPGNHDSGNVGYLLFEVLFGTWSPCCSLDGVTVVGVDSSQPDIDDGHIGREMYKLDLPSASYRGANVDR